jgi:hypothetical protein
MKKLNRINEKINKKVIGAFAILLGLVVLGKISSRIFDYNDETDKLLSIALFSMLGITYLGYSWVSHKKVLKLFFLSCGIYLIVMNFLDAPIFKWIAIVCVLTPLLIILFSPKKNYKGESMVD